MTICFKVPTFLKVTNFSKIIVFLAKAAWFTESTYVKHASTKSINIEAASTNNIFTESACTGMAFNKSVCIGNTSVESVKIGDLCAENVCTKTVGIDDIYALAYQSGKSFVWYKILNIPKSSCLYLTVIMDKLA